MKTIDSFRDDHFFLSNFYLTPVTYEGIKYPSSEHAFQAAKTKNIVARKNIARLKTPALAKAAGRSLVLRPDWDAIKIGVMRDVVTIKFENPELRQKLLDTGNAKLVEMNGWNDRFWGVCNGVGQNWLGKILMELRATIRRSEEKAST